MDLKLRSISLCWWTQKDKNLAQARLMCIINFERGLTKNYVNSHKLCFMLAYDGFQERPIDYPLNKNQKLKHTSSCLLRGLQFSLQWKKDQCCSTTSSEGTLHFQSIEEPLSSITMAPGDCRSRLCKVKFIALYDCYHDNCNASIHKECYK